MMITPGPVDYVATPCALVLACMPISYDIARNELASVRFSSLWRYQLGLLAPTGSEGLWTQLTRRSKDARGAQLCSAPVLEVLSLFLDPAAAAAAASRGVDHLPFASCCWVCGACKRHIPVSSSSELHHSLAATVLACFSTSFRVG
jgi:hypothetical protein